MTDSGRLAGIEIILLAAGGSSRLGRPKQLEQFAGQSLLSHAAVEAVATGAPVHVVLGSQAEKLRAEVGDLPISVVINRNWRSGMASSIHAGFDSLDSGASGALIMLCDQPLVTSDHLEALMSALTSDDRALSVTEYNGVLGVPAVFAAGYFKDIMKLSGDEGARKIITRNAENVAAIGFPDAGLDIDTEADVQTLGKSA